jgi:hypothetical protein
LISNEQSNRGQRWQWQSTHYLIGQAFDPKAIREMSLALDSVALGVMMMKQQRDWSQRRLLRQATGCAVLLCMQLIQTGRGKSSKSVAIVI